MAYFDKFPRISYDINGDGKLTTVVNVFRRYGFRDVIKNNFSNYRLTNNEGSDRPHVLSARVYNNPNSHWVYMLLNDTIDPFYDWVLDEAAFEEYMDEKYPGSAFFIDMGVDREESSSSSNSSSSSSTTNSSSSSSTEQSNTSSSSSTTNSSSSSSSSSNSSSSTTNSSSSSSTTNSSSSTLSNSSSSSSTSTNSSSNSSSSSKSSSSDTSPSSSSSSSTSGSKSSQSSSSSTEDTEYPHKHGSSSSSQTLSTSSESNTLSSSSEEVSSFTIGETVTFSGGVTGTVHRWDATLRKLEVKDITGIDDVTNMVGYSVSGGTSGASGSVKRVVAYNKLALHHFENDITGPGNEVLFEDVWLNPRSYIVGYINNNSDTYVKTNYEYEYELNEAKRNVKEIPPPFIQQVNNELDKLLEV